MPPGDTVDSKAHWRKAARASATGAGMGAAAAMAAVCVAGVAVCVGLCVAVRLGRLLEDDSRVNE